MTDNFVFDFGKVIVEFEPDLILSPYIADPEVRTKLVPIVFDRRYWDRLDDGTMTEREVFSEISPAIPREYRPNVGQALEKWYYDLPVFEETVEIIRFLKAKGKRLFLLSNISISFADGYKNVKHLDEILSMFDGLIMSGRERAVKPDPAIFGILIDRFSLDPAATLLIDDSPRNVNGALSAGLKGFVFKKNYEDLKKLIITEI